MRNISFEFVLNVPEVLVVSLFASKSVVAMSPRLLSSDYMFGKLHVPFRASEL